MISPQQIQERRRDELLRRQLGPQLLAAIADPAITDIIVNEDGRVWFEAHGKGLYAAGFVLPESHRESLIGTVAAALGTTADNDHPIVEGELPEAGKITRHPRPGRLSRRKEAAIAGEHKPTRTGFRIGSISLNLAERSHHLIGVRDPALRRPLIGGEQHRDGRDGRQDQKDRHRPQQDESVRCQSPSPASLPLRQTCHSGLSSRLGLLVGPPGESMACLGERKLL